MAVAWIKADKRWFRWAARQVHDQPRMVRELLRARDRPGLTANLTASETRLLAERCPEDARAVDALARLEAVEAEDVRRKERLQALTDRWRAEGRW
jgi:hypothetical protein